MLSCYRVVDLAGQQGIFCGYLLARLGAQVTTIEPPGGAEARRQPPLAGDHGVGLWWQAYTADDSFATLDLESQRGRESLLSLAAEADILIESFSRSEAARLGVEYATLATVNPRLVVVTITPFGCTGPKADWPATDLTIWAASGAHALAGDADRAPVRTSVPQAFLHAGADAAGAAMIALQERHRSGRGQHIDVSAQQSSAQAALSANLATPNNGGIVIQRIAGGLASVFPIQLTWRCQDGYVAITFLFGPAFTEPNRRLLSWLHENGACSADDAETDWGERIAAMGREEEPPDPYYEICSKIAAFTATRRQRELFEEGLRRGVYIAPTFDIAGLLEEPHFKARGFWESRPHPLDPGATVRAPGPVARFTPEPKPATSYPPVEQPTADAGDGRLPLAGLKVLDFMWVIAGPFCTRVLADYGATVIKVESTARLEPARAAPTFKDGEPGVETGVPFANFNAGKLGVTIDPANPVGREVILDLVRWADVVSESFSPKAMRDWQLDYESLKAVNPDLIMLSSCLMGQTGPRAEVPGYGNMAAAITGFYDLTGWPDRSPAGPYLAYTDGVSPRVMLLSLLAALDHRRRSGEGRHIDVSQAEAAIHLLAPAILDREVNGRTWHRMGNRDRMYCPHGVYPALGDDCWIAIACQSDAAFRALCEAMAFTKELTDESLSSAAGRFAAEDTLDQRISEWTRVHNPRDIEKRLIGAGVACHMVQNSPECMFDPQLSHRKHFVPVQHASEGEFIVEGTRFKLSRTPGGPRAANPELGEHNLHVLTEILGYDEDRIADIFASLAMV